MQKLKTVFEERKNTTHSRDLGTLVRSQSPTILLLPPAEGALTTETQNKHLYYSRMDDARSVQCERQAFTLYYRTRTLYYALSIDPGRGGWYNGGKLKTGEQGKCIKHLYILDIFL